VKSKTIKSNLSTGIQSFRGKPRTSARIFDHQIYIIFQKHLTNIKLCLQNQKIMLFVLNNIKRKLMSKSKTRVAELEAKCPTQTPTPTFAKFLTPTP